MFDRYAICTGYYWFAVQWHGGQGTKEYAYLGRLETIGYKPSLQVQKGKLGRASREVYWRLVRAHMPTLKRGPKRTG